MEFKNVDFKENFIENCKKERKWQDIGDYLKDIFKLERDETGEPIRFQFSEIIINKLQNLLDTILEHEQWDDNVCYLLVETIKALRNNAINEETQNYLVNNKPFFDTIDKLFKRFLTLKGVLNINVALSHKYLLQLLLNMLTSNPEVVPKIYSLFYDKVCQLFLLEDKHVYEMSALIYNLTRQKSIIRKDVIERITDLYETSENNEFLHFLIEKIISEDYFWEHYSDFSAKQKILILEILKEDLLQKKAKLSSTGLECIVKMFLMSANVIFQVEQTKCSLSAYEASTIVQILSMLSSDEEYLKVLQTNKDILINAGVLLINIHRLGKDENNCFTPIQKLSDVQDPKRELREHPAFGFKADLVRLIGNLCWKNKLMQDLARVAEIIPVLLDCCNMDAKNPFIIQWGILAIRNLCENNPENQNVISGLHHEGTVSSDVLEEMGLTLHTDGESSLKIVPLDSLRNKK